MFRFLTLSLLALILLGCGGADEVDSPDESIARKWNELLLESIRTDFARPTVHARNLFHMSIVMYDAWAAYDDLSNPFFLGSKLGNYECPLADLAMPDDVELARKEAISYASFNLLSHRFSDSPNADAVYASYENLMHEMGFDTEYKSVDYEAGSPAALGNYIAKCIIEFGLQDGSNESSLYANESYQSKNAPFSPDLPGNPSINDLNRWQPIAFDVFIDQAGNILGGKVPEFLSPEWGRVVPFSLTDEVLSLKARDGIDFLVYHDPGEPPLLDVVNGGVSTLEYQWSFAMVALWSSHLDPADEVMWDISPASIGNTSSLTYPQSHQDLRDFYDAIDGGDIGAGHTINPITGEAYEPQFVPRGDYTRVLAEFWADGPDSETPPGHWFTILNKVNDHPLLEKRIAGVGDEVNALEWDVKSYFALGGAMHDSAIAAWSIKGWYDYVRPISAIRGMAGLGQSSNPNLDSYHIGGLPLVPGFIEIVEPGDGLAGDYDQHLGKLKIRAWRGPGFIEDPELDTAGVDWILAENWWPYQRPTFITPPFAGYVSGHSTFSRAAAEVLTLITGDEFFPGGIGEFEIKANEFLVFEEGPSVDLVLQWATYRDASDQTSLSRIWGGIHPPVDDIPGRLIGEKIGISAFELAQDFFLGRK